MEQQKPKGLKVGWQCLQTRYPYTYPHFRIRQDRVRLPTGQQTDYAYMETKGAVWIVPLTPDGQVVLIRQYRYAIDDWCWEVPAGGMHDHQGSLESLARRELAEEVGGTCEQLVYVGWHYASCSVSDEVCHVFLARDVHLVDEPQLEAGETIETHLLPLAEALAWAHSGRIKDGKSAMALILCESWLKQPDRS